MRYWTKQGGIKQKSDPGDNLCHAVYQRIDRVPCSI